MFCFRSYTVCRLITGGFSRWGGDFSVSAVHKQSAVRIPSTGILPIHALFWHQYISRSPSVFEFNSRHELLLLASYIYWPRSAEYIILNCTTESRKIILSAAYLHDWMRSTVTANIISNYEYVLSDCVTDVYLLTMLRK